MLSEEFFNQVGIFNFLSVKSILARIEKSGTSTEVDNMLITFIISTHLLYDQYINKNNRRFKPAKLANIKIVEDF